jgi:hypothetical protein
LPSQSAQTFTQRSADASATDDGNSSLHGAF